MAEKMVLLCDRCGTEAAERLRFQYWDSVYEIDLCERHRKPVEALIPHSRQTALHVLDPGPYEKTSLDQLEREAQRGP